MVDLRVLKDRNFAVGRFLMVLFGLCLGHLKYFLLLLIHG